MNLVYVYKFRIFDKYMPMQSLLNQEIWHFHYPKKFPGIMNTSTLVLEN